MAGTKGANGSQTSPARVATAERNRAILELRKQGKYEADIGWLFGISKQRVSQMLIKEIRALPNYNAEEMRRLDSGRVDRLWDKARSDINSGDIKAIGVGVAVLRRRSELGIRPFQFWQGCC